MVQVGATSRVRRLATGFHQRRQLVFLGVHHGNLAALVRRHHEIPLGAVKPAVMQEAFGFDLDGLEVLQVGVIDEDDLPRLFHVHDELGLVMARQDRGDAGFGVIDLLVIDIATGRNDLLRLQRVAIHDDILRRPIGTRDGQLVFPAFELRGLDRPRLDADLDRGHRGRGFHPQVDHVHQTVAADHEQIAARCGNPADVHGIAGVDDRLDLIGAAIDQRHLTGIAQRDRHQVVDVDVVHLFFRAIFGFDHHLPRSQHLGHAPFGRGRRFQQQVARHQVDILLGQRARGAPVRHPRGRAVGDEALQIVIAVFAGDVGGQRLARGPLAQDAVAAGAAFEIDRGRLLEFLLGHHRVIFPATGNFDLDLTKGGHRRFIGGGGAVGMFLGLFFREHRRGQKPKGQGSCAQKGRPGGFGSGGHGMSPFSW